MPPAPDLEKAGADNDEARASAAGKPAKRPSLKGKGDGLSALAAGSGESNGESRGGSRETSGNSGKLKARAKSMRADWGNDHEDVELSNVRLQPMTDDPAMAALDSPMGRKNTKSGLDRWAAVQTKTKLVGKMLLSAKYRPGRAWAWASGPITLVEGSTPIRQDAIG